MLASLSKLLDNLSEFLAHRKGLLPVTGMAFILLNFILRLAGVGWLSESDLFLHLGILVAILGFMLAWAL